MRYCELGKTGFRVSEIGFGTWAIGGLTPGNTSYGSVDDKVSIQAIQTALDCGINFFDTANIYGNGHSEEILGQALRSSRQDVIIASKCGMKNLSGEQDFTLQGMRSSIEGSLRRLRRDRLDLLQLHDCPPSLADDAEFLSSLETLREEGKFAALGVSVKSPQHAMHFLRAPWQSIQCNLNMIDQRAIQSGLTEKSVDAGISIIARTPLAFGFLSGRFACGPVTLAEGDHRRRWSQEQLQLWADAPRFFAHLNHGRDRTLSQLAILFCNSFRAVATTIPGITSPAEAIENARVGDMEPLADHEVREILRLGREKDFILASRPIPGGASGSSATPKPGDHPI